jgi:hypothetical protein
LIVSTAKHVYKSKAHTHGKHVVSAAEQMHLKYNDVDTELPAQLELYIGAPVILRVKNVCQELHISNGNQGILRGVALEETYPGEYFASTVIVEFPDSPVQLDDLPRGYFPLDAISCTVTQ